MNEKKIIEVLGRLKGEADAPTHRAALRRALLSEQKNMPRFAALNYLITFKTMKRYYIPLAALALVVAGAAAFNPGDPAVAQAQEQAQRAFTRAIAISPEMRAELEGKMKADMLATLKEAMAAPDLKIMTKEEYQAQSPFSFSTGPAPMLDPTEIHTYKTVSVTKGELAEDAEGANFTVINGSAMAGEAGTFNVATAPGDMPTEDVAFTVSADAMMQGSKGITAATGVMSAGMASGSGFSEPVKYLSYTDPRGNKTVLGLDKDDTPVFKLATLNAEDVMHFEDGGIGIKGQAVQMMRLEEGVQVGN